MGDNGPGFGYYARVAGVAALTSLVACESRPYAGFEFEDLIPRYNTQLARAREYHESVGLNTDVRRELKGMSKRLAKTLDEKGGHLSQAEYQVLRGICISADSLYRASVLDSALQQEVIYPLIAYLEGAHRLASNIHRETGLIPEDRALLEAILTDANCTLDEAGGSIPQTVVGDVLIATERIEALLAQSNPDSETGN